MTSVNSFSGGQIESLARALGEAGTVTGSRVTRFFVTGRVAASIEPHVFPARIVGQREQNRISHNAIRIMKWDICGTIGTCQVCKLAGQPLSGQSQKSTRNVNGRSKTENRHEW